MQHVDPDQLALLALGERQDGDEQELTAHLAGCATCQHEVRALRQTAELARETVGHRDEEAPEPPESVWSGIVGELGLGAAGSPPAPRTETGRAPGDPFGGPDTSGGRTGAGPSGRSEPGPSRQWEWFSPGLPRTVSGEPWSGSDTADRGRQLGPLPGPLRHAAAAGRSGTAPGGRRWARAAMALAAAAAVGVLGTLAAVRPWQEQSVSPPVAVSPTASLAPVAGGPGGVSGRALVVRGADGPQLRIDAAGLPPLNQGYYEVWVFDGGVRMVSVGILGPGSTASLPLPTTLDLRTFAIVDISQEKYDGDQTHSETSVLRGTLSG